MSLQSYGARLSEAWPTSFERSSEVDLIRFRDFITDKTAVFRQCFEKPMPPTERRGNGNAACCRSSTNGQAVMKGFDHRQPAAALMQFSQGSAGQRAKSFAAIKATKTLSSGRTSPELDVSGLAMDADPMLHGLRLNDRNDLFKISATCERFMKSIALAFIQIVDPGQDELKVFVRHNPSIFHKIA